MNYTGIARPCAVAHATLSSGFVSTPVRHPSSRDGGTALVFLSLPQAADVPLGHPKSALIDY
jgi:hypothetical protein